MSSAAVQGCATPLNADPFDGRLHDVPKPRSFGVALFAVAIGFYSLVVGGLVCWALLSGELILSYSLLALDILLVVVGAAATRSIWRLIPVAKVWFAAWVGILVATSVWPLAEGGPSAEGLSVGFALAGSVLWVAIGFCGYVYLSRATAYNKPPQRDES